VCATVSESHVDTGGIGLLGQALASGT
jgi:hypothetical protein